MLFSSLLSMPLAVSEPLFVPGYWNPQAILGFKIFSLNFDLESFIFCFAIGGIAAVIYEVFLSQHLKKARERRIKTLRHFYLLVAVLFVTFALLIVAVKAIYAGILSMGLAAVVIMITRKDLRREIVFGGVMFAIVYFAYFVILNNVIFPDWISKVYNLKELLGINFLKIPIEELLWALTFGALWAPLYEDLKGYTIAK